MGHAGKARLDRQERVVRVRPAGTEGSQRAAVVAVLQDDQVLRAGTVLEGQFHRHLAGQAAMQGKAHLVQRGGGDFAQLGHQPGMGQGAEVGADMGHVAQLRNGRFHHPRVVGPQVVGPGLGGAVDVFPALVVPDQGAACLDQVDLVGGMRRRCRGKVLGGFHHVIHLLISFVRGSVRGFAVTGFVARLHRAGSILAPGPWALERPMGR